MGMSLHVHGLHLMTEKKVCDIILFKELKHVQIRIYNNNITTVTLLLSYLITKLVHLYYHVCSLLTAHTLRYLAWYLDI